jgi:uncharacterized membrane protein
METQPTTAPDPDVEANKTAAALAYLWILCLVILFFKRDSKFSHFHAKQGLLLFAIEIIIGFATFIPFVNIIWLPVLILAAVGIYRALDGQMKPLPFIGHYAERINL